MLEVVSPLHGAFEAGVHGQNQEAPGIALRDHPYGSLLQVTATGDGVAALVKAVKSDLSVSLPEKVGETTITDGRFLAKVGPNRFWLVHEADNELPESFISRFPEDGSVMTLDLTHGRHRFRLEGEQASMLIAKGTAVQVREPDRLVMTSLGHVQTAILPVEGGFDLYPARSFARHLFGWCLEQGLEFGVKVSE